MKHLLALDHTWRENCVSSTVWLLAPYLRALIVEYSGKSPGFTFYVYVTFIVRNVTLSKCLCVYNRHRNYIEITRRIERRWILRKYHFQNIACGQPCRRNSTSWRRSLRIEL